MKTLYLVRHAKSSWKDTSLPDQDRPLNKRGEEDAPRMGKRLKLRQPKPQVIISSPAVRARETAKILASEIKYPKADIVIDEHIYSADLRGLVSVIRGLDDDLEAVLLVGHNPALTELVNWLARCDIPNVPTCGIVVLGFQVDSWGDVGEVGGELLDFDYPKKEMF